MALAVALVAQAAALVDADVVQLLDGDRISGRVVAKRKTTLSLKTAYGSLTIPRAKIARIAYDDGSEELVSQLPQPTATPTPVPLSRLVIVVTGHAFWHAWDPPKGAAVDPTLRLQLSLDEDAVATYTDATADPRDLPGALVNSFSFEPDVVAAHASGEARVQLPETRPGRAVLRIELPSGGGRRQRLRLAYQVNEGSAEDPAWRDRAENAIELELRDDGPTFVAIRQNRGKMEFSGLLRRKMKHVETFRIEARQDDTDGS